MKTNLLILFILAGTLLCWHPFSFSQPIQLPLEHGVDRPGSDFRNFALQNANPGLCRSACVNDRQCRAWTYVKPGHQGPQARCWLKTGAPPPQSSSCCTSGVINVLREIETCRDIGNVTGTGPVECVGPGGWNFGKAGRSFKKGDKVMILSRFQRLHPGNKEIIAVYSHAEGGKFVNFSNNKKVLKFKNDMENWAFWFPAHFTKDGRWRVNLAIAGKGLTGQVIGRVEYCINCPLE